MKKICILGSTGSIGTQTLDVARNLSDNIEVIGLSTNTNIELLQNQIDEFKVKEVAVVDEEKAFILKNNMRDNGVKVYSGANGLLELVKNKNYELLVNSLVGNVGLIPTITAIECGKNIALANKETLVTAGEIVMNKAKEKNVSLFPIDSEHSAILQCLEGNSFNNIHKIYLTASGGPFRTKSFEQLKNVSVSQALSHPNWVMGSKITIDSATLMNKGLEVIEAKWLFDVPLQKISVLVHPQSIIHSMVEFEDGAVMAQLGEADMRIPIQYALTYPKRIKNNFDRIDFLQKNSLTFEAPNTSNFPCLQLAFDAIETGGTLPAVLNAANEVAVSLFLKEKISFLQIPELIGKAMKAYTVKYNFTIDDVLEGDRWAREYVLSCCDA